MKRKNKVICGIALGAVAILITSGLLRCSPPSEPEVEETQEAPVVEALSSEGDSPEEGGELSLSSFVNSKWLSRDKSAQLVIAEGALIETNATGTRPVYWSILEEKTDDAGLSAMVALSETMNGEQTQGILRIDESEQEGYVLTCDALGASYVYVMPDETKVTIDGGTDALSQNLGCTFEDLEEVLSAYASARSPHASLATWDGEVWIDCYSDVIVTGFQLNDAAGTLVNVTKTADGKLACA